MFTPCPRRSLTSRTPTRTLRHTPQAAPSRIAANRTAANHRTAVTPQATPSGTYVATLAVRDGWMTYQMSWSAHPSSSFDDDQNPPGVFEVGEWLRSDTKSTLPALKG
jgi:hypothetical protein